MGWIYTMTRRLRYFVVFVLIIFAGCSIKDTVKKGSDEELLRERVMTYATYRINKEFEKAYPMEDPLYRKKVNLASYMRRMGSNVAEWKHAEIKNVRMEGDAAEVDILLRNKFRFNLTGAMVRVKDKELDNVITQEWIKADDAWYHVFRSTGISGN